MGKLARSLLDLAPRGLAVSESSSCPSARAALRGYPASLESLQVDLLSETG
jgi:hypothetical protein